MTVFFRENIDLNYLGRNRLTIAARRNIATMVLMAGTAMFGPVAQAQNVTGEVTDYQKAAVFQGATVTIEELKKSTTTDERGRFRLSDVPQGEYTLVISYLGAKEDTRMPIKVDSNGLALGEIILGGSDAFDEIIVYGQAAAFAGALNQERAADNLVSVLDTDAMGQFPDQNVAEALRRITGVSVENDQGEGRFVVIRGIDPDLNSTSINGVRATSAGGRRAVQLDVIPSDVLDGLEVHKTLNADMDGDAIGGSINVKTLSAFSRKGAYLKARAEGQYNEKRDSLSPKVSVAGSNIYELNDGRRLGVAAALSWQNRKLLVNNNEADNWAVAGNGSEYPEEFQPRLYTIDRERISGALNFDLDISGSTTLHLYSLYSKLVDDEVRSRLTFAFAGLDEDTISDTRVDFSEVEIERDVRARKKTSESLNLSFGSKTQLTDWLIETNLGYSSSKESNPDEIRGSWLAEFNSGEGGGSILSLNRDNWQIPVVQSDSFATLQDASLYELDDIRSSQDEIEDTQYSAKLDVGRETGFGAVKFGVKARWREKSTDEESQRYSGDGTFFLSDATVSDGSQYGFPTPLGPVPDASSARMFLANGVGLESEDLDTLIDSNVADFVYNEDIYAAYGMGRWDTDKMVLTAGVRLEYTETESAGNIVEFLEEGTIVNGVPLPDDTVLITPVSQRKSYTDILPSANIKYSFNDKIIARASAYKSVVRPRIEDVAFRVEVEDNEAVIGNPNLDPFRAWNFDASIAFYPTDLSVISGGVFYKKISDFVFVQTIDDYNFDGRVFDEARIALNGDSAEVLGFEFTYQQHFGFLGAPFDGFLMGLNYTYVDSSADTGEREVVLPKQSSNIVGFTLGYDKHGFDIRIAMKYRDQFIDELEGPDTDRIQDSRMQWDITAKYRVSDRWQVYAEVINIGSEPELHFAGSRGRLLQYDEFGLTASAGIQFTF